MVPQVRVSLGSEFWFAGSSRRTQNHVNREQEQGTRWNSGTLEPSLSMFAEERKGRIVAGFIKLSGRTIAECESPQ
jgi:hypothetical protein